MSIDFRHALLIPVLALLSSSLLACDPKAAAGSLGARPGTGAVEAVVPPQPAPVQPGPDGGLPPSLPPAIDPLHDPLPLELPQGRRGGLGGLDGGRRVPSKLPDTTASAECRCHLECEPGNDEGCIEVCVGTGCG